MERTADGVGERFAQRTRRAARGPAAADALAERLAELGERVAVLVPARDEAATVGGVVRMLAALGPAARPDAPVLHELVVIDGGSTDTTVAEAEAAGARVVRQSPAAGDGTAGGKGAALALGLASTSAGLVVTVDADLTDPDPDTVVALVDALVDAPSTALVKACYDRPLALDGHHRPEGGGRVTELLARPLIATLWPELGWLAQPLAGEWAVRRALVAELTLEAGYGVELGLVLDVARLHGVDAIAQVDLGARGHRHHDLATLGRMSTEILAVALDRLAGEGRLDATALAAVADGVTLWQPGRAGGELVLHPHDVRGPASRGVHGTDGGGRALGTDAPDDHAPGDPAHDGAAVRA